MRKIFELSIQCFTFHLYNDNLLKDVQHQQNLQKQLFFLYLTLVTNESLPIAEWGRYTTEYNNKTEKLTN